MKILCRCGDEFDFEVYSFPENQDKSGTRRPCPKCRRSYELSVKLVKENEEFWRV